jgi:hypothetical protein
MQEKLEKTVSSGKMTHGKVGLVLKKIFPSKFLVWAPLASYNTASKMALQNIKVAKSRPKYYFSQPLKLNIIHHYSNGLKVRTASSP